MCLDRTECKRLDFGLQQQGQFVSDSTDNQLIQQAVSGRTEAYEELVLRYQDRLVHSLTHSLCSYEDALEITQQTFLQAWQHLDTFRGEAGFYSWLYRIARNTLVSRRRRERLPQTSWPSDDRGRPVEIPAAETSASGPMEAAEQVALVREALGRVSEDFRQPLVMKELDGFSYEDIATILEIPTGTVRSRIFRGRAELAETLQRYRASEE